MSYGGTFWMMRFGCQISTLYQSISTFIAAGAVVSLSLGLTPNWDGFGCSHGLLLSYFGSKAHSNAFNCPLFQSRNIGNISSHDIDFDRLYQQCVPSNKMMIQSGKPILERANLVRVIESSIAWVLREVMIQNPQPKNLLVCGAFYVFDPADK